MAAPYWSHYLGLDGNSNTSVGAQTALQECISWDLLDCENFNCLPFPLSGAVPFSVCTCKHWTKLMSLSCTYCCFLPLTFMACGVDTEMLIAGAELTKCSGEPLLAVGNGVITAERTHITSLE